MRRVLLTFDPPDGGVATSVRQLALGLEEHGWQPQVAGPSDAVIYGDLEQAGVRVSRLPYEPGYEHFASDVKAFRGLRRLVREEPFDVVHAHNAKAGVLARLALRGSGIPVVYSPHCFPFVAPFSRPRTRLSTLIERAMGRLTDRLICVANDERDVALDQRIVSEGRLRVIHNGVPSCSGDGEPDAALEAFRSGRPMAATLCVLREQKAVDVFVAAAPTILERCPDSVLAVIGNGDLEPELRAQAGTLGLGDRFRFFDFQAPSSRQLGSIDVLVLSSSWEAFPISILEAMACGVPQVATDVGGTAEAVVEGETGLLCPPSDPDALAERVATLLLDEGMRERMAQESRRTWDGQFRVETMVESTAHVYDELVPVPA